MVTTRRRVVTEQDRFGGYAARTATIVAPAEEKVEAPARAPMRTFTIEERFVPAPPKEQEPVAAATPPVIEYSTRPYAGQAVAPVATPGKRKAAVVRETEDVMPSIRSHAAAENREKTKFSQRTKVYLGIYLAVAAVLAVLVIATGIAVGNINATADRLERELNAQNEVLTQQNAEILHLTDKTRVTGAAVENGMEKVDSVTKVDLLASQEPVEYEGRTNWFDRFCDWLSNLIGG